MALVGFLLFAFGVAIGVSANGPSVAATAFVVIGFLLAFVGLMARLLVF